MTRALTTDRRAPLSGDLRSAVIFLHGYGANGADLMGLADPLAEHMPDTMFLAPDAPEACPGSPMGYQWFPIPWIDGSSEEESHQSMLRAADDLNAFLDGIMVDEDLLPEQVMLFGFSQGTMMSLHVAPRREDAVAGIAAFSGRLMAPELLADEVQCRPPVLLVHGDEDEVVPVQSLPQAAEALQEAGWKEVYAHVMKGTGHGIAPDGLSVALAFMRERLGY
ncbi:alpha/beta fold hydrolase [Ponticoccus sp. SC2-23]|uniref:alpha/beta hydrolase n=1 Tax=Alexandriicola marinus TaxID=2081710 RepID=UPI000FD995DC|nr:alpha/beta fold hydrolase [Alexandriicola marinus]MBM1222282.1 alpha/beta fold hydrolase [Ponticoccus sp. SC6-9]MBM1224395.1 alpha/beta fold hydrolase [Ponticoccus sp. SC6-15]MBM1229825.1 alpha/beta fold hydrolase [Ponticoccus sp. SC6-38]MBM1233361.1 alpha/beta fold hydrolase [Ponticoccus sp. SC6-45]MBM1236689.1 alpha/beta fold hydrolase [Ponticoccus sp. SC6-49]MBM1244733.1 alpha/beta fold hydrolase [Ponticoccus sp. SC2-64]MBM1246885.1 alpha/beta fold hydrolase [Ponticoccus sp. SC6-42]MB